MGPLSTTTSWDQFITGPIGFANLIAINPSIRKLDVKGNQYIFSRTSIDVFLLENQTSQIKHAV